MAQARPTGRWWVRSLFQRTRCARNDIPRKGSIHNVQATTVTSSGVGDAEYRLEAAEPLPLVDLLFSPASLLLTPRHMELFLQFLRKHYRRLDRLHRLGMVLHVVVFVVPQQIGWIIAIANFVLCVPLLVCAFLLMSNEVILLLMRRYEFWFFSAVNTVYVVSFAMLLGDLRVVSLVCHAMEIHLFICMDANSRTMTSFLKLDVINVVRILVVMMLLYVHQSDAQAWGTRSFGWQITKYFRVQEMHFVINCSVILVILLLRKSYSRKKLHDGQGNATRIVRCVFCRCKMMAFNHHQPIPKAIRANNFQRSRRVYQDKRIAHLVRTMAAASAMSMVQEPDNSRRMPLAMASLNHRLTRRSLVVPKTTKIALDNSSLQRNLNTNTNVLPPPSTRTSKPTRTNGSFRNVCDTLPNRVANMALDKIVEHNQFTSASTHETSFVPGTTGTLASYTEGVHAGSGSATTRITTTTTTTTTTMTEQTDGTSLETSIPASSSPLSVVRNGSSEINFSQRSSGTPSTGNRSSNITLTLVTSLKENSNQQPKKPHSVISSIRRRSSEGYRRRASMHVHPWASSASAALGEQLDIPPRKLSRKKCLQLLMLVASRVQTIDSFNTIQSRLTRCGSTPGNRSIQLGSSTGSGDLVPLGRGSRVLIYGWGILSLLVSVCSMVLCLSATLWIRVGATTSRGICIAALVSTAMFGGGFMLNYQLELLGLVVWSFDYLFSSIQFMLAAGCLMDMLQWDHRCLAVASWCLWFHFCLCLDALPPPQRRWLGFRKVFVTPVLVTVLLGIAQLTSMLVIDDTSPVFESRSLLHFRIGHHVVDITTRNLLLNRLFMVFLWGLRLTKDVAWCPEEELILIRGELEYFTPLEMFPAQDEPNGTLPDSKSDAVIGPRPAIMPSIPSLQRGQNGNHPIVHS